MFNAESFKSELLLSEEDKRQRYWAHAEVDFPNPLSPLFASFMAAGLTKGTPPALEYVKHPMRQYIYKLSDGRLYQAIIPYPGNMEERLQTFQAMIASLLPQLMQRLQHDVEQEFLPFYRHLDECGEQLTLDNAREKVLELFAFYQRAWQLHFEIIMPRSGFLVLESLYTELTGEPDGTVVYDMLTGVMNKSLETDRALWKLSELAKQSPETAAAFAAGSEAGAIGSELEKSAAGRQFLVRLQEVLEKYGHRSANSHEFADETWVENPEHVLRIIASYVRQSYDFDAEFARTVQQREAKAAEVLAKLPEGEQKDTFMRIYEWALASWGLEEDHHFYIDAMLPAKSRRFLLRVGDLLTENGVLSDRSDVVYLYLDELLKAISSLKPMQRLVAQRKIEHEANKQKQVPPYYGTPPQRHRNPALERLFGGKPPEIREHGRERAFSGYAASRGTYTGTVKVVLGPQDFAKVQPGDVLVCRTTTPPWTVLFSFAGAIVTDAGGILSHAGTVAREYRLPAVVGTKVATSLLKDGDRVTVDGTEGWVYIG